MLLLLPKVGRAARTAPVKIPTLASRRVIIVHSATDIQRALVRWDRTGDYRSCLV